jgi:hypothetical protein
MHADMPLKRYGKEKDNRRIIMIRAYCTCKECKKQLETYSRIEKIAEIKRSIALWKHYKKEHNKNIAILTIKYKIEKYFRKKMNIIH